MFYYLRYALWSELLTESKGFFWSKKWKATDLRQFRRKNISLLLRLFSNCSSHLRPTPFATMRPDEYTILQCHTIHWAIFRLHLLQRNFAMFATIQRNFQHDIYDSICLLLCDYHFGVCIIVEATILIVGLNLRDL